MGLWVMAVDRVVLVIDEPGRYGFVYGTLPGHVERGEERFLVEIDADEKVWYSIVNYSRPAHPLAWIGYPVTRHYQRRFVNDSCARMQALTSQRE